MGIGLCVPRTSGRAGLGNEIIVWAKAYLAARALEAVCVPPIWGINPRGYRRYFRSSRLDVVRNELLLRLIPCVTFTADAYRQTGIDDFGQAFEVWSHQSGLTNRPLWSCAMEGMWGGYHAMRSAREFLRKELLQTRWTVDNLTAYQAELDPNRLQIAFHIRGGDFLPPASPESYRGKFNLAIPLAWYIRIAHNLRQAYGRDNVQFTLISDGPSAMLEPFASEFSAVTTSSQSNRDISDLLALSLADVLVCSISSYSMLAAFLSKGLYLWYEPQMSVDANGFCSLWGDQRDQQQPSSPTARNARLAARDSGGAPRGFPVNAEGEIPDTALTAVSALRRPAYLDLIHYGVTLPARVTA
jgi:hypothetical protein